MWIFCLSGSINSLSQQSHGLRCATVAIHLLGMRGSNPTEAKMCLLWVLCVVRQWSLHQADHSPRGVLPSVVSLNLVVKPQWGDPGPLEAIVMRGGAINWMQFISVNIHYKLKILVIKAQQLSPPPTNPSSEVRVSVSENHTFGLLMTLILWQMTLNVSWRQCNPQWHG